MGPEEWGHTFAFRSRSLLRPKTEGVTPSLRRCATENRRCDPKPWLRVYPGLLHHGIHTKLFRTRCGPCLSLQSPLPRSPQASDMAAAVALVAALLRAPAPLMTRDPELRPCNQALEMFVHMSVPPEQIDTFRTRNQKIMEIVMRTRDPPRCPASRSLQPPD